jgi:copper chaperone CopZ
MRNSQKKIVENVVKRIKQVREVEINTASATSTVTEKKTGV